jgi:hypothetical protein
MPRDVVNSILGPYEFVNPHSAILSSTSLFGWVERRFFPAALPVANRR